MDIDEAGTGETPDNASEEARSVSTREDADGWIQVTRRRRRANATEVAAKKEMRSRSATRRGGRSIVSKVLRASKMPRLPRDHIKIVVRPKDGLDIRKTCGTSVDEAIRQEAGVVDEEVTTICPNPTQNILVISTPDEKTATKIAKIKVLTINGKKHETNAYVSVPEQMAKGIVRNIPLMYTQDQLLNALVSTRNPSLTYAKRLGSTTNVILLYEGNRVPTWVYFNSIMLRVSLYRKQIDFFKECGRLGHRPDVFPRPDVKLCPICGLKNPSNGHECTPKCRICGEGHPTADRTCKDKYKVPHIVKQRRWRARTREERDVAVDGRKTSPQRIPSTSGYITAEAKGRGRLRSRSPSTRKVTWSGIAAGRECVEIPPLSGCPRGVPDPALSARMEKLDRENKELREELVRARKQNETSARKIDELQQTLNEILKCMEGSSGVISSTPRGAAAQDNATATGGEGETDMCFSEDAQATTGSKRKSPSGVQTAEDAASHAQVPKRPRPGAGKINAIEEIVNKLTDKTERMLEMLLTRLNESDAQRNAQYVEVIAHLAAMNKRIEDIERRSTQTQQHLQQSGRAGVAQVVNVPAILNRGRNTNATRTGAGGTHGQSCPPNTSAQQ
ncbi:hypothetical protein HPB50_008724 [Hyalomma asiaticum]|uniref:Uncharacterized protein n=1 Tax=Hyalomma asiaticum TaxID=266040 RepID=A0ACB7TEN8_HYAAI|nr:hypothetical protein HPB50_008724 [Hyalomma asiaticum]